MIRTLRYILTHPVSRVHRGRALSRYLRWQIGSRLLGWPVAVPFIGNTHLIVEPSMTGATGNIYCGLHEFHDMAFVLHFLRPEDLFVDVGANVGSYTVLSSGVVGSRCISFEPVPKTFGHLERNVFYNRIDGLVHRHQCAVGSEAGEIRFSVDCDTMNHVVSGDYPGRSQTVPLKTLNELLAQEQPALWKVDVEGFEEEVLTGADQAIDNDSLKAVLLESDSPVIEERMGRAGFAKATYSPFDRLLAVGPKNASQAPSTHNHLWIRKDSIDYVENRCRQATVYEVHGCRF